MPSATSPSPPPARRETARVRAHLEGALRGLEAAPAPPSSPARAARRRRVIAHLRRYIAAERYPTNRVAPARTPVFVDASGARCAVAALLEATGRSALVARVARTANLAYVRELAGDAELAAWLDHHGLTPDEAARIQPAYSPHADVHWQPTVSVVTSSLVGASTETGAQLALAPAVRVGVRRVGRYGDDHGRVSYGGLALVAEYARSFVVGSGSTNHVALLFQWEPTWSSRDVQGYFQGGPLASWDEDAAPGTGYGAQLGVGLSFRTRGVPLFFELAAHALTQGAGVAVRGGPQVGLVW